MGRNKLLKIAVILFLFAVLFASPRQVSARSLRKEWPGIGTYGTCDGGEYQVYYDFRYSPWGFLGSTYMGTWTSGIGFVMTNNGHPLGHSGYAEHRIRYANNEYAFDWREVTFYYYGDGFNLYDGGWLGWDEKITDGFYTYNYDQGTTQHQGIEWLAVGNANTDYVYKLLVEGAYTGDCPLDGWPEYPPPYRPLVDDDMYEVNHVDGAGPIVDDVHTEHGATVYNAFDGTVVFLQVESGGYTVKVLNAYDDSYVIYSNLESVYPSLNDEIEQGCKIGTVGESFKEPSEQYTQDPGLLWFYAGEDFYDYESNDYIDWVTDWDEPPVTADICGTALRSDNCLNYNPGLNEEARGWVTISVEDAPDISGSGTISDYMIGDGQVQLTNYNDIISQYMTLDDEEDYYLSAAITPLVDYTYLSVVVLKATTMEITDSMTEVLDYTDYPPLDRTQEIIEFGPFDLSDADSNDMYLVGLMISYANHSGYIIVEDICVHVGDAVVSTQKCYFDNYKLEGDTGWDDSGTVGWSYIPLIGESMAFLGANGWISQAVSLSSYDGADADYRLTVKGRMGINSDDPSSVLDIWSSGWDGDLAQEVWSAGPTLELDIGDITIGNIIIHYSYSTDFTVSDGTTLVGDLTLTADSGNTYIVSIDEVCLEPVSGIWPGEEDTDIRRVDDSACAVCAMPTGLGMASWVNWVSWIWCNLQRFFNCDLAGWIASIGTLLRQVRDFLGLLGRYLSVILQRVLSWWISVLGELADALKTIFQYVVASLWNAIAGLSLLEGLFDLIGYISAIILGLASFGSWVFDLATDLVNMLFMLARLVGTFLTSISAAYSGSVPTVSLPSCETSDQMVQAFCAVFIIAQGVFDEFPSLAVSITMDMALLGLATILITIDGLGSVFGNV